MKTRITAFALAIATSSILLSPTLASAAEDDERVITISYADLDLTDPDDLRTLDRRITRAARDVCGYKQRRAGTRIPTREARACVADVKQRSEQRMAAVIEQAGYGG